MFIVFFGLLVCECFITLLFINWIFRQPLITQKLPRGMFFYWKLSSNMFVFNFKCLWRLSLFRHAIYYISNDFANVIKFVKVTSNSTQCKKRKKKNKQNTSFPKESVENADLYKTVWYKLIITHEKCLKYNFVAPLKLL